MKLSTILAAAGALVTAAALATPTAAAAPAAPSGVDATTLMSRLDAKAAAGVPDSVTGWHVDQASKQVVVSVLRADTDGLAWARSLGGPVRVEHTTAQPRRMWDIIGGQAIYFGSGRCSVGFNARNASGTRYVITAGHCTELGGTVNGVGGVIGPVAGTSFPGNDYGIIRVTNAAAVSTPLVDRYSSGSDVTVIGKEVVQVGQRICRSGSTTQWRCGTVQAFNQSVNYGGGDIVTGLTRTNACAQPGDSGGPYVSFPTGTTVQAQGVLSGGSGNCSTGGTTFFQPVNEILTAYGLTLITG
ncbi:S1 family peptidase [Actinokineospora guangxiensis]|uniref:S1 family peptidase n=1 Tax=Actinokineospora guangxiensis TaxID=1490288 RepID=A0ABW0ERG1_9PSEU